MFRKLTVIIILIVLSLFFHYYNKHKILQYRRKLSDMQESYEYIRAVNSQLITTNNQLRCRGRILHLAQEELGMSFPIESNEPHIIRFDPDRKTFCLIDYIIPSAQAITRE